MTMTLQQVRSALNILSDMTDEQIKERAPKLYEYIYQDGKFAGAGDSVHSFIEATAAIIHFCYDKQESEIKSELLFLAA